MILGIRGRSEIVLQSLVSILDPFINSDFILAILHSSWITDSFTGKL